jgi:hypothetical protein
MPFRLFMIPRMADSMPATGVRKDGHPATWTIVGWRARHAATAAIYLDVTGGWPTFVDHFWFR